jgi:serine O-acetyltransferase
MSDAAGLIAGYRADARAVAFTARCVPAPDAIAQILQDILALIYPGYFGRRDLTQENLASRITAALADLEPRLEKEIRQCLRHDLEAGAAAPAAPAAPVESRARALSEGFLERLPHIRDQLIADVQAAYDGDPAATGPDEIILAYPGLLAVSVYRVAHALHVLGVPLMPRIMTEWAHSRTGCDIHPAADIGPAFFIDHGTGVVIGATAQVGAGVRLYQGVTLGAMSLPRDPAGQVVRGEKRHPTVESGVTIYANATILGGQTVIGADSVIGGSVFITRSVAPRSRVSLKEPDLRVASRDGRPGTDAMYFDI